jgi:hypothetical protein
MKKRRIVVVILLIVLVADLYIDYETKNKIEKHLMDIQKRQSLPCKSIPLSWALKNYRCANDLLAAMNITALKFNPPGIKVPVATNHS